MDRGRGEIKMEKLLTDSRGETIFGEDHPHKVLIIDDLKTECALLEDYLTPHHFIVRCTTKAEEAITIIKEWHPEAILLNLLIAGTDSLKLCEEIREIDADSEVGRPPLIITSREDDKSAVAEALQRGADDFMVKPVAGSELVARVRAQVRIHNFNKHLSAERFRLKTLMEITEAASKSLDTYYVLDTIVEKVAAVTGASRTSIVLIVDESEGYVLASQEDPEAKDLRLDLSKYPELIKVFLSHETIILDDMAESPLLAPLKEDLKGLEGMSALIVPIVFADTVLGTLFLRARRESKSFTPEEVEFCQIVANSSYTPLKNARQFEKVMKENERLQTLAITDYLTTLYNQNFFYTRLEEEFDRSIRYGEPLAVIMLDIDDFKAVNDSHGHRVGDAVLKELAGIIKNCIRKTDIVARYGGEEFTIILPHTSQQGAEEEAERIRVLVEEHLYESLESAKITISLGLSSYPYNDVTDPAELVNLADEALYRAKENGKNRVESSREGTPPPLGST